MDQNNILFRAIGKIVNNCTIETPMQEIKNNPSKLVVEPAYKEGFLNIGECEYLDVVFYFDQLAGENIKLSGMTHSGAERGVFASRSPRRPNLIGITTVRLLEIKENELLVEGLDALNDSPILDIKCCDTSLFAKQTDNDPVHQSVLKSEPRIEVMNHIINGQTDLLLIKAAQIHGHYCPGLAMGIMAATYAMRQMKVNSDGMEDLLAITETNNCFADGVQLVTGCSLGNNSLIYKDLGKTAFTLTRRDGKGIRVCSRHESQDVIRQAFPDFNEYYRKVIVEQNHSPELVATFRKLGLERAFGTLKIPFESLFTVQEEITVDIPAYAAIHESVVCSSCHESVMKNRTIRHENQHYCYTCAKIEYMVLDGNGIHHDHG